MIIETRQDWLEILDANWGDLSAIVEGFMPGKSAEMPKLREANDLPRLHLLLEQAWGAAPDSPRIHSIPGWSVLCDLCSEGHAIREEEER